LHNSVCSERKKSSNYRLVVILKKGSIGPNVIDLVKSTSTLERDWTKGEIGRLVDGQRGWLTDHDGAMSHGIQEPIELMHQSSWRDCFVDIARDALLPRASPDAPEDVMARIASDMERHLNQSFSAGAPIMDGAYKVLHSYGALPAEIQSVKALDEMASLKRIALIENEIKEGRIQLMPGALPFF